MKQAPQGFPFPKKKLLERVFFKGSFQPSAVSYQPESEKQWRV
jgi:hypothetical protein